MAIRKIIAPLGSAFILPGVGQIVNRQPAKAVTLILVSGLTFAAGLFLFCLFYHRYDILTSHSHLTKANRQHTTN